MTSEEARKAVKALAWTATAWTAATILLSAHARAGTATEQLQEQAALLQAASSAVEGVPAETEIESAEKTAKPPLNGPSCPFCSRIQEEVIAENEEFFVKATYGMMGVEGYVLLMPKAHVRSYGDLPERSHARFVEAADKVVRAVRKVYGAPIVFEHGVTGQTVGHAHLHVVPGIDFDKMAAATEEMICKGKSPCAVEKKELGRGAERLGKFSALAKAGGYLYIGSPARARSVLFYVGPGEDMRMILRRAAAAVLGDAELADWKKTISSPRLLKEDEVLRRRTREKLRPEIVL